MKHTTQNQMGIEWDSTGTPHGSGRNRTLRGIAALTQFYSVPWSR